MKKALLYTTLGLLAFTGCNNDEDPIQPTGNYSVLRFEFPQGNNPFDEEIKEIHDKYDVYLLYKDITDTDLNRQWQSLGTGKLLTGDPVPDEYVPFYINFIKNHVFQYLSPEVVRAGLPVKIYMLENFGEVNTQGSGTGTGTGGIGTPNTSIVTTKTDGFDYWAISFKREGIEENDPDAMRQARCQFIYQMILPQYKSGKIVESQTIHDKLDFETSFSTDVDDPDYRQGPIMRRRYTPATRPIMWIMTTSSHGYASACSCRAPKSKKCMPTIPSSARSTTMSSNICSTHTK